MKTAIMRLLTRLRSITGKFTLLALAVCAPPQLALAGMANSITIVGGNNQSGQTYTELPNQLSVGFSNGSYVTSVEWIVTSGAANFQENGSTDYIDPNFNGVFPVTGQTSNVRLDLGGNAGPVTVQVICTGCVDSNGAGPQTLTFNETVTPAPPLLQMNVFSGNNQTGPPSATLPSPLIVQLTAQPGFDGPFDVPLQWEIHNGSASFTANHGQTYAQTVSLPRVGRADRGVGTNGGGVLTAIGQVSIDLGATPGPVVVVVLCPNCNAGKQRVFNLTVNQPSAGLQIISGNGQTGAVNSAADAPLVVQLGTPGSNVLSGQPISWAVTSGQATLSATSSLTDQNGQASITFNYGGSTGPLTIEANSPAGKADFTATAFLATASAAGGNNQTAAIGSTLQPFAVQLAAPPSTTGAAKGLSQVPVTWKVTSGGGTFSSATTYTDANGQATNALTLGTSAGITIASATVAGVSNAPVNFTATAIGSAGLTSVSGGGQTAAVGSPLQPFVVQVTANGHSIPGINVNWTVLQGGGTLASAVTVADGNSQASNILTLGPTAGVNVVQASLGGLGNITFTATGAVVAGGNSQFTIVSGNNQPLTPGQASQPLIVKLVTTQGQPLAGVGIAWSASSQAGKLTTPTSLTDATGQAQNTFTVTLPGSYSVTAQVSGTPSIPALTFNFNNGVANLPSLSPTQVGVASAIDKACPALATSAPSQLTPAQVDLLKRCSEVVVASGNNEQQVPNALNAMANNKVLPQNQLANSIQLSQGGNLNTRLAELRQGAQGISVHGLTYMNDGQTLPLAMLGDLFRTDPKQADDQAGKDFDRWGFFATGIIERGGASAQDARPGFDFHNASITAGVDYRFNDSFVAGGAVGYNQSNSSLDQSQGKVDVDGYSLNGYFTWYHNNDFYIEGSLVVDWLNYDLNRNIAYQIANVTGTGTTVVNQTASASPGGQQESLSLSIGKDFNRGAWSISPYLRGIYTHLSLDGFSETIQDPNAAGSGLGTSVDSRSINSALAVLGTRFSYTTSFDWGVLVPNAVVEWNHELKNDPQVVVTRFLADPTQTPIVITGQPADENYFNLGIGLNAVLPQGRSGFLLWEHLTGYSGVHENRYSLGIRVEF